jgi:hypothetical protein
MDRRTFLQSLSAAPLWNGRKGRFLRDSDRGQSSDRPSAGRKAVLISMLPNDLTYLKDLAGRVDRFLSDQKPA